MLAKIGQALAARRSQRDNGSKSIHAAGIYGDKMASNSSLPHPPAQVVQHSVEISYLEIYNETVRDLFNPANDGAVGGVTRSMGGVAGGGLRVREDPRCEKLSHVTRWREVSNRIFTWLALISTLLGVS